MFGLRYNISTATGVTTLYGRAWKASRYISRTINLHVELKVYTVAL